jgi:hypothetical protein
MEDGRLIRVGKNGDPKTVGYIVAISDAALAVGLIKTKVADPDHEVLDLGRVSDNLIKALKLMPGEFIRADQMSGLPPDAVV